MREPNVASHCSLLVQIRCLAEQKHTWLYALSLSEKQDAHTAYCAASLEEVVR